MKKLLLVLALCSVAAFAQTPEQPIFPSFPLPAAVSAVGSFNQLGSPKFSIGLSAIYPIVGQQGVYGSTTADIYTKRLTSPTGQNFWGLATGIRQGLHKSLITVGRTTFLLGGDIGSSFSSAQPSGLNVNFSSSFIFTTVIQVSKVVSIVAPERMLYVGGAQAGAQGWNPVLQAGFALNLSALAKK
jgi:hypothetical protein